MRTPMFTSQACREIITVRAVEKSAALSTRFCCCQRDGIRRRVCLRSTAMRGGEGVVTAVRNSGPAAGAAGVRAANAEKARRRSDSARAMSAAGRHYAAIDDTGAQRYEARRCAGSRESLPAPRCRVALYAMTKNQVGRVGREMFGRRRGMYGNGAASRGATGSVDGVTGYVLPRRNVWCLPPRLRITPCRANTMSCIEGTQRQPTVVTVVTSQQTAPCYVRMVGKRPGSTRYVRRGARRKLRSLPLPLYTSAVSKLSCSGV